MEKYVDAIIYPIAIDWLTPGGKASMVLRGTTCQSIAKASP
jgi:hypothetical protein